jgi:hypothetical protein
MDDNSRIILFFIIIDNYVSTFSLFSATIFTQQKAAAQAYLQTIKNRHSVIDLDNGVKPMLGIFTCSWQWVILLQCSLYLTLQH